MTQPLLNGIAPVSHLGVIRALGEDAAPFLHGQLTNDFALLDLQHARLAAFCTAKGRMLASFIGFKRSKDEILLLCDRSLLAPTLKRLSMFVLRAKCKLSDASAELPLWGLAGATAGIAVPWTRTGNAGAEHLQLPASLVDGQPVARALWVGTPDTAPEATAMDLATWQALEVLSGVARIVAATSEQFVPQMVNLELVGGVNFKKGCYPGQEVVARSQYRGTLKRRAYVLMGDAALQPGQEVFLAAEPEQPAGMVALAGQLGGRHVALVETKIAAVESGAPLHAGSATGPALTPGALPYDLARDDS
jgi:folate-binding protein YgfZ